MGNTKLLAYVLVIGGVASGCTDAGSNLYILGNDLPSGSGDNCTFDTNLNSGQVSAGVLDVSTTAGYTMFPVVQNAAPGVNGDSNQNIMLVRGFDMSISFGAGFFDGMSDAARQTIEEGANLTLLQSFTVKPGGIAVTQLALFQSAFVDALGDSGAFADSQTSRQMVVNLTAFGSFDGGDVESTPFPFPISVCSGCLVNVLGACPQAGLGSNHPCGRLQDFSSVCCTEDTGVLTCE